MTIRQWYKGMAIQGLLTYATVALKGNFEFAAAARDIADAMLAEDLEHELKEKKNDR
jgi:hypothetical protein